MSLMVAGIGLLTVILLCGLGLLYCVLRMAHDLDELEWSREEQDEWLR